MSAGSRSEWAVGKWSLTAAFLGMMIGPNVLPVYSQAFFLGPLEQEFGWSRIEVSFGITLLIAALTVSAPIAGFVADRVSIRLLVAGSALACAANFAMLSQASSNLLSFYAPMTLMAIVGAGCSTPSFSRIVASRFKRHRGAALGIAMSGTGVVTIVMPIFLGPFILSNGWRSGYLALAGFELLAALTFLWLLREPEQVGPTQVLAQEPSNLDAHGMTLREATRTSHFWLLAFLFLVLQLIVTGLLTQMAAVLVDRGMTSAAAAQAASGIGVAILLARLLTGFAIDRVFAPYVACAILLASATGLTVLIFGGPRFGFYGAFAAGLVIGSEIDMIGYLTARYYGLRNYGRIYGSLYAFLLAGTAISPLLYAWIYELDGNYDRALAVSAAGLLGTALLCLGLPRFPPDPDHDLSRAAGAPSAGSDAVIA